MQSFWNAYALAMSKFRASKSIRILGSFGILRNGILGICPATSGGYTIRRLQTAFRNGSKSGKSREPIISRLALAFKRTASRWFLSKADRGPALLGCNYLKCGAARPFGRHSVVAEQVRCVRPVRHQASDRNTYIYRTINEVPTETMIAATYPRRRLLCCLSPRAS
jgi:hypothetical protein